MGNSHPGIALDKAYRDCSVGGLNEGEDVSLDGARPDLAQAKRVSECIKSYAKFERDVLEASAFAAVAAEVIGFRLEFEAIGRPGLLWAIPRMTYVKVKQVFTHAEAPPRVTSVRGFYALLLLIKDLWAEVVDCNTNLSFVPSQTRKAGLSLPSSLGENNQAGESSSYNEDDEIKTEDKDEDKDKDKDEDNAHRSSIACETQDSRIVSDVNENECPVCLDANIEVVSSCGHGLCKKCFRDWYMKRPDCPMCRVEGKSGTVWVIEDDREIVVVPQSVNDLVQHLHAFVQMLPPLETRWEKEQRLSRIYTFRQRERRSRGRSSSDDSSLSYPSSDSAGARSDYLSPSPAPDFDSIHLADFAATPEEEREQLRRVLRMSLNVH
mmetsp:Transcript_18731/g.34692  ORF Transcript_18731/g.34692 Transcript_18731/m.34692 type:complete len:380 (-) Transcript_18731:63-1202(-)|eukprot:CAMPEP_0184527158 /NCGR_PEP_ID=MMETSP0198_2-20121128/11046_1 /TAXON_ID=1112570 /ORGANISM="Thraustochytrium sp., Strain LLF1b" /LENGTH=379 /DNA_ID=CAMNT_0026918793 /DNA_START=251 /DNA_END=1390 /DNA_ORIENTATION=+